MLLDERAGGKVAALLAPQVGYFPAARERAHTLALAASHLYNAL